MKVLLTSYITINSKKNCDNILQYTIETKTEKEEMKNLINIFFVRNCYGSVKISITGL